MKLPLPHFLAHPHLLAFNSFPDFADNTYAFYLHLEERGYWKRYRFVWLVGEVTDELTSMVRDNGFHCSLVKKKSLKGVWTFLRCRHFFTSHGGFQNFDTSRIPGKYVNLWHGMPLKRIGRLLHDEYDFTPDLTIASSTAFQRIMVKSSERLACALNL